MPEDRFSTVFTKLIKAAAQLSADPFTKVTRTRQNYLLLTSAISLAVAKGLLIVEGSSNGFLGLKFAKTADPHSLIILAIGAILYYLIVFLLCAWQDMRVEKLKGSGLIAQPLDYAMEKQKAMQDAAIAFREASTAAASKPLPLEVEDYFSKLSDQMKSSEDRISKFTSELDQMADERDRILGVTNGVLKLRTARMWVEVIVPAAFGVIAVVACGFQLLK